jgi:hypothetical protein
MPAELSTHMKNKIPAITLILCLAAFALGADSASTPSPSDAADLQKALTGLLQDALNGKGGWMTTLLILIGGLRLLVKPVMNVMGGVVCETKINGYRTTWWFRFLEYTLDLTASVKIARPAPDDASPQATADDAKSIAGKEDPLK